MLYQIDRCIKTIIRIYGKKVYTNFWDLNKSEGNIEFEPFTVIFIDFLPAYKNKSNYFDNNLFED